MKPVTWHKMPEKPVEEGEDRAEDARIEEAQERWQLKVQRRVWRQMESERRG
jgi:hypothetical protein